jgi:lipoate-protein ligase A
MRLLDLTLPSPAENLALDEALLETAEEAGRPTETLRLWEPPRPMAVIGRASRVEEEVRREECERRGIPVLRRTSGGAAIVAGPGCLMYAVVLSYELRPHLRLIDHAHQFVLGRLQSALRPLAPEVEFRGTCDLALNGRKVSGNSMRARKSHLLYHGTVLYDFDLDLIEACLKTPPRQPDYRQGRSHREFVANLSATVAELRASLAAGWETSEVVVPWPEETTRRLAEERYSRKQWNFSR